MDGYWQRDDLTAETIIDGWLHTGDIARMDDEGYLFIVDRKKDMIISGGFNVFPREVEDALSAHPAVVQAAVFGVPHEKWGETPVAVVCVAEGAQVTSEELISMCKERLGSYKKPSTVTITTDPLPKTVVGKLSRKELRAPFWADHERRVGGV